MFGTSSRKMLVLGVMISMAVPVMAQGRGRSGRRQATGPEDRFCPILSMPLQSLEEEEKMGLIRMREEEKLARDVYQELYATWSDPIFQRISLSEGRHMESVKVLIDRYGLEDPTAGVEAGEFRNNELQALYMKLVSQGRQSPADALRVGALIEDLDLKDLGAALVSTDNDDISIVYENLMQGSRNHMRAFAGRLDTMGESYVAQYIGEEELAEILSSRNVSGTVASGRGRGSRQRGRGNGICLWNWNPVVQ